MGNSYLDSKKMLDDFRHQRIKTEFDAAYNGSIGSLPENLACSALWPIATLVKIVPYIVVMVNNK